MTTSITLGAARNEANAAFDAHCDAWDRLNAIEHPTQEDIEAWLVVREAFYKAQEKFENILRQIVG